MAYFDTAAVIVTLILVGKTLEARARATAGDASRTLLSRMPAQAVRATDDGEDPIAMDELRPGMHVVVLPRRDGPGRRRGRRGCVVRRPFPADRGIGARRRGAGQRGGRGLGQRARPAGGVRVRRSAGRHGSPRSCGPCKRRRDRRRRSSASPTGSPRSSSRSCSRLAAATFLGWIVARRRVAGRRVGARDGGRVDRVSVRARARHARGDHDRHRTRRRARGPAQGRRGRWRRREPDRHASSWTRPARSPRARMTPRRRPTDRCGVGRGGARARGRGRDGLRAPDRARGGRGGACAWAGGPAGERASGHTGRRRERARRRCRPWR